MFIPDILAKSLFAQKRDVITNFESIGIEIISKTVATRNGAANLNFLKKNTV